MARECAMLGRDFSTSVAGGSLRGERPGPVQRSAAQQICVAELGDDRKDPQAFRDLFDNLGAHRTP